MESNNSIEELIIRYLQNEIQEDELRLCAPEPGVTSGGGTAWFWNFKRK